MTKHFQVDELQKRSSFEIYHSLAESLASVEMCVRTHIGPFDFCPAFSKTVLDVFPFFSLMISQTSDEVIQ